MRAFAYRLLGRREYSEFELDQRLQRKWPEAEPGAIADLIQALVAENLLSDVRFAESWLRTAVQRNQGPLKIRAALRGKGVDDVVISAEIGRRSGQWTGLAADWLQRQHPEPLDFKGRRKFYRRLLNRGFTHDQAMDALNRHL